jgi:hypothetical protein
MHATRHTRAEMTAVTPSTRNPQCNIKSALLSRRRAVRPPPHCIALRMTTRTRTPTRSFNAPSRASTHTDPRHHGTQRMPRATHTRAPRPTPVTAHQYLGQRARTLSHTARAATLHSTLCAWPHNERVHTHTRTQTHSRAVRPLRHTATHCARPHDSVARTHHRARAV